MTCFVACESKVIIAIASDGAGSASHGGEGASLACRTLGGALRAHFRTTRSLPDDEQIWRWIDETRDRIGLAAASRGLAPRDFAATLVLIVSDGQQTMIAHVGDGAVVVRESASGDWKALSWPAQGEYASTTFFVTDDPAARLRIIRSDVAIGALAAFTDGIERLALDYANQQAHQPFFRGMIAPLGHSDSGGLDRDLSSKLAAYLDSPAICERTDDDKTLILALRR